MKTERCEIRIRGMICRSCTDEVSGMLLRTKGVVKASVSYRKALAAVSFDPALVSPEELEKRIKSLGYDTGERSLAERALDLGCTPVQAFFKVTIHEIMPGIISGAIMAFTMSLDDFVISYFVTGLDFVTLPVEIYTYTKKPIQPKIYAMFTLLFLLIFVLMVISNVIQLMGDKKRQTARDK